MTSGRWKVLCPMYFPTLYQMTKQNFFVFRSSSWLGRELFSFLLYLSYTKCLLAGIKKQKTNKGQTNKKNKNKNKFFGGLESQYLDNRWCFCFCFLKHLNYRTFMHWLMLLNYGNKVETDISNKKEWTRMKKIKHL